MDRERKAGWGFWITVVLIVFVLYVLSFGPVAWILIKTDASGWSITAAQMFYSPLIALIDETPAKPALRPVAEAYEVWWCELANE